MIRYVAGLLINESRTEVALITKSKPLWQQGKLNAIGGKVELGEPIEAAMNREFIEEAGLDLQWEHRLILCREGEYRVDFFTCFSNELYNVRTMESEEVGIYKIQPLPENMISNLHWIIPMLCDSSIKSPRYIEDISGN